MTTSTEGQTSTTEWDELAAVTKEHERTKPAEADGGALPAASFLDRLIAELPDEHEQQELPGSINEPSAPKIDTRMLLTAHGWPKRYVEAIDCSGGTWQANFALALPVIREGGILIEHGTRGTGKTRMAAEIARKSEFPPDEIKGRGPAGAANEPKRTALYRTAMEFFVEVRATYKKSSETTEKAVIEHLSSVGLLVIDELQERGESAFEDRLLTHLIDRRYSAMLPTILIANLTQTELQKQLGPSILDRYRENGRRIEFTGESFRKARV